jgi:hypothetical protein
MRVYVYVDGFNLYYRALRKSPHKWLNLVELSKRLLDPADQVLKVRYFTARVRPRLADPDAPRRQQLYLSALGTQPIVSIHYGRFLKKTKWRPVVHPTWNPEVYIEMHDTEEKGSDVSLAVHLLNDCWHDRFDAALVFSQDSDLLEPLRMVSQERLKKVGLIWMDGRQPSRNMVAVTSFVRHLALRI